MNNQKRLIEVMLYVILLCVGIYFYLADFEISSKDRTQTQHVNEVTPKPQDKYFDEVPQELLDYNFKFEGE